MIQRLKEELSNRISPRQARWMAILFLAAFIGAGLTLFSSLNPVLDAIYAAIVALSQWAGAYFKLDELLRVVAIFALLLSLPLINRLFSRFTGNIDSWRQTHFRVVKIQDLELLTPNQFANLLIVAAKYIRYALFALLTSLSLTLFFSLYPQTEGLARAFLEMLLAALLDLWARIIAVLPDLLSLLAIIIAARLALKLLRFLYDGLKQGKVRYAAIHPELVEPTYHLLRFLVVAFALVAAFPFIPGSSSPVFRGISIFVGFLLSLGSTSLVTNIVSGIVLTYTRGLKVGDRVQISDAVGDVIDRTLLVTRVRTIKNEIISIPNAKVMQDQIVNYSALADEQGLILHTSVTIGYEIPWRQVHHLLTDAAQKTTDILEDPAPFVLQNSLDDHYVVYELNAYTAEPVLMADTYSHLHKNIQDNFIHAGVEIMSPAYFAFRNGRDSAIPQIEVPNESSK